MLPECSRGNDGHVWNAVILDLLGRCENGYEAPPVSRCQQVLVLADASHCFHLTSSCSGGENIPFITSLFLTVLIKVSGLFNNCLNNILIID